MHLENMKITEVSNTSLFGVKKQITSKQYIQFSKGSTVSLSGLNTYQRMAYRILNAIQLIRRILRDNFVS